jgi:hypothetical protein
LSVSYAKLEEECAGLRTVVDTLRHEKLEAVNEVTTIRTKFQVYLVRHRKKLHKFRANLEAAVNEIGVKCLTYPGKCSTIGEVIEWFDKEIQALSNAIVRANKNFLCYCIAGVLRMLYDNDCGHVEELQTIMNSCNASILHDIPDEIGKLSGCIVRKWWSTYGLPYVTEIFCITPEERMLQSFLISHLVHPMLMLTSAFVV